MGEGRSGKLTKRTSGSSTPSPRFRQAVRPFDCEVCPLGSGVLLKYHKPGPNRFLATMEVMDGKSGRLNLKLV